jgi:two-component system, NtrC family, sensor histidine kinase HydH
LDLLGYSALLAAVTSFSLGFSVLAGNVRNKLFLAFALVCTLISAWATFFFLSKTWPSQGYYQLHLFFNIWLAPASLVLIRIMARTRDKFSRRLQALSFIFSAVLSFTVPLGLAQESLVREIIYYSPAFLIVQVLYLLWVDFRHPRHARETPGVSRDRRYLIYLGALLVLTTAVMDHVPWLGTVIPVLGNFLLPAYLFFISQAISQQRLLNFNALLSRLLVLVAVALTLTAIYSLLVAWIDNSPGLFFLNSFIASFLILTLLDPLRTLVRHFTRRLLPQTHLRLEQVLRESQRKLAGIVDSRTLIENALETVQLTLQPQWAGAFLLNTDGTQYRRIQTRTMDSGYTVSSTYLQELLVDHPLLEYCLRLKRKAVLPVLLSQVLENEIDRSAGRAQKDYFAGLLQGLDALGANLLIPFLERDRILGFIALRVPHPPEPWGSSWGLLEVIYPYFEQAAGILRTMEVYVRQKEMERLAALGEMAAGLAHEIRNPLGAIKGAAQFLDPSLDRPESRFLKVIIEETDRLNRVVTQFLEYSKPHSVDLQPVDVAALARKTLEILAPTVPGHVRLSFQESDPEKRGKLITLASAGQIQQVLINLLLNSFKALEEKPSGEVKVRVHLENGRIAVLVEDNGRGISPEHLDKLFIPFFTTSPSGTGLGLPICQKIIQAHQGRIEVESSPGEYSRFSVFLPFSPNSAMHSLL